MHHIEWTINKDKVSYEDAVVEMDSYVAAILSGKKPDRIWLLEHPAIYTAGTSANMADLLTPNLLPVFNSGRGGQFTYHGPGQRVAYVMIDLKRRQLDIRNYICLLENWIITTLAEFNILGQRRKGRVGVWVKQNHRDECKIAAIGVRIRRGVTYHGVSLNVEPDLSHYDGIVPCGIKQYGVTSLSDLGHKVIMDEVDAKLKKAWAKVSEDP